MKDYKESDPFYHSAEWKRIRAVALQRAGGMCEDCMARMRDGIGIRPRRAVMVHHVIPRSERPDLELEISNLRALCNECHNREHPEKRDKAKRKSGEAEPEHRMRIIRV